MQYSRQRYVLSQHSPSGPTIPVRPGNPSWGCERARKVANGDPNLIRRVANIRMRSDETRGAGTNRSMAPPSEDLGIIP